MKSHEWNFSYGIKMVQSINTSVNPMHNAPVGPSPPVPPPPTVAYGQLPRGQHE
jgi:hypothetical protein